MRKLFGKWKKDTWVRAVLVLSLLAVVPLEAFGRGGGGGGAGRGGGGGGAGRAGGGVGGRVGGVSARPAASRSAAPVRSVSSNPAVNRSPAMRSSSAINRTPSMSRAVSNVPSRSNIPSRSNVSPQINQVPRQIGTGRTPSNVTQVMNQLGGQLGNQGGIQRIQPIVQQPAVRTLPHDWRQQWGALRTQGDLLRERVREDPRDYLQRGLRQGYQWWDADRRPVGADWRRPAHWGALNTWLGWGATPVYYDYADGLYYYAPDDQSYAYPEAYGPATYGDPYSTYPYYTYQELTASQTGNWLPLGLFVVTSGAASSASPKWYLELAVDSQGNLEGYFYNAALNISSEVAGIIDPTTQEARWQYKNQIDSTIFSTGAYNLTQGEATAQMTYPDGRTAQLFLVRIDRNAVM